MQRCWRSTAFLALGRNPNTGNAHPFLLTVPDSMPLLVMTVSSRLIPKPLIVKFCNTMLLLFAAQLESTIHTCACKGSKYRNKSGGTSWASTCLAWCSLIWLSSASNASHLHTLTAYLTNVWRTNNASLELQHIIVFEVHESKRKKHFATQKATTYNAF